MVESHFHPEDRARSLIDRRLDACGWLIQSRDELNLGAGLGVAVREFQTASGPVDYALFVGRRLCGVIELLEPLADELRAEIVRLKRAGAHWRQVDNVTRRLRRVYEAADRFGHYVGQPSSGVSSPAYTRMIVRALAKYAVDDPSRDPDPNAEFEMKPRIRVKAISIHVPPAVSLSQGF